MLDVRCLLGEWVGVGWECGVGVWAWECGCGCVGVWAWEWGVLAGHAGSMPQTPTSSLISWSVVNDTALLMKDGPCLTCVRLSSS